MKQYFKLPGFYEGLTAKRIAQSGRLWLVRVVNDLPPYWFVIIRNFNLKADRASGATSIGVWRFGYEDEAFAQFAELEPLYPPYAIKPPTPAQIAVRNRVRLHGIPKIHKQIPANPVSERKDSAPA